MQSKSILVILVGGVLGQNYEDTRSMTCPSGNTIISSTMIKPSAPTNAQNISNTLYDQVTNIVMNHGNSGSNTNTTTNTTTTTFNSGGNWIINQLDLVRSQQQVNQTGQIWNELWQELQLKNSLKLCRYQSRGFKLYGELLSLLVATGNTEFFSQTNNVLIRLWQMAQGGTSQTQPLSMTQYQQMAWIMSQLEKGTLWSAPEYTWLTQILLRNSFRYYDSNFTGLTHLTYSTWFTLSKEQQTILLQDNGISAGLGIGGYLLLLARLWAYQQSQCGGNDGNLINYENRNVIANLTGSDSTTSYTGYYQEGFNNSTSTDIFLLVSQALLSRDINSLVGVTLSGQLFNHRGRLYRLDAATGQLVLVADLTPATTIQTILKSKNIRGKTGWLASKLEQSQTIDSLLCVYEYRARKGPDMEEFFTKMKEWFVQGRVRGLAPPSMPPPILGQCQQQATSQLQFVNGTSIMRGRYQEEGWNLLDAWETLLAGGSVDKSPQVYFDVETKLQRLCNLRKENLISSTEYSIIREMIEEYANTTPTGDNNETTNTNALYNNSATFKLAQLLSKIKRSRFAPDPAWLDNNRRYRRRLLPRPNPLIPRKRCLPHLVPVKSASPIRAFDKLPPYWRALPPLYTTVV